MTDDNGTFGNHFFNSRCMVEGLESFQYPGSCSNGMSFIANDILDARYDAMQPAGLLPGPSFLVQPVGGFQGLFFIEVHENIEVGEPVNAFQVI